MKLVVTAVIGLAVCVGATPLSAQSRARDGATAGGLAGAVIGGIVGHQNDETTEGIVIGGVVGAIAGGLMGDAQDQQMAREECYRRQIWRQQQAMQSQVSRRTTSIGDVVQMAKSGVSDSVIMNYIQTNGIERKLDVHDIISMHQQGVSESVIASMQRAPIGVPAAAPATIVHSPPTVIVHEAHPYYGPPHVYEAYPIRPSQSFWR